MQAVVLEEYGSSEVLQLKEIPKLEPCRGKVRVRVHASALNRADIEQQQGNYPPPTTAEQEIPGLEFAGVVDKLGPEVRQWSVGTRVVWLAKCGGYAESEIYLLEQSYPLVVAFKRFEYSY